MSAETKFKTGDVITDGLVNGEIIVRETGPDADDGYRIRITSEMKKATSLLSVKQMPNQCLTNPAIVVL